MQKVIRNSETSFSKGFTKIKKNDSRRNNCWQLIISSSLMIRTIRIWERKQELKPCSMSLDKLYKKAKNSLTHKTIKKLKVKNLCKKWMNKNN